MARSERQDNGARAGVGTITRQGRRPAPVEPAEAAPPAQTPRRVRPRPGQGPVPQATDQSAQAPQTTQAQSRRPQAGQAPARQAAAGQAPARRATARQAPDRQASDRQAQPRRPQPRQAPAEQGTSRQARAEPAVTVPRPGPRAAGRLGLRVKAPVPPSPAPWRVPPAERVTGPQPAKRITGPQQALRVTGPQPVLPQGPPPGQPGLAPAQPQHAQPQHAQPQHAQPQHTQPQPALAYGAADWAAQRRMPFVLLLCGLLGGALVCALVISTTLAEGSFQITKLQDSTSALARQRQILEEQVAQAQSAEVIGQEAAKLGMRRPGELRFLDLTTGKMSNDGPTWSGAVNAPGYNP